MVSFFKAIFSERPRCSDNYREISPRTDFWPHNDPIWSCILDSTLWQVLDSRILCQRNLDYGFRELNSGFTKPWIPDLQSSGFRIPQAEISRILDSSSNVSWIPESGLPYMGRDSSCMQAVAIALIVRTVPLSHQRWFHMTDAIAGTLLKTNWKSRQSGQSLLL